MDNPQPKVLPILFIGEFLEKFSFWGLQSLLVLYLTKSLNVAGHQAYVVFGAFTALAFALSVPAGFLADKVVGFRNALILGVLLIITGNVFLGLNTLNSIYTGLAIVALGTPLFITNITNLLGIFYEKNDLRRNRGFIIFYMATNLGGLLGPLIYGIIAINYGWHFCFMISATLLSFWLILLVFFNKGFRDKGLSPAAIKAHLPRPFFHWLAYFLLFIIVIFNLFFIRHTQYTGALLSFAGIGALLVLMWFVVKNHFSECSIMVILLSMIAFCLIFFAIEFQVNSSLLLFAEQHVNRSLFHWTIPANTFASLEPFFVILLAPAFAFTWKALAQKEPSPFLKITLGLFFEGASFLTFALASHLAVISEQKISIAWLLLGNLLLGAGEICIMPTVISSITKLAPLRLKGTLMGMLYLALAFSGYLAGMIATLTTRGVSKGVFLASEYTHVYNSVAYAAFLSALIGGLVYIFTKRKVFLRK